MIYLDHAATTPMTSGAIEAYKIAAERFFGNASSLHDIGSEAERALDGARKTLAEVLNVPPRGIRFTGSGSEASFLAITSIVRANRHRGNHLITTGVEHSSVRNTFAWLENNGYAVTRLPVNRSGRIEPGGLERALRKETILVSVQYVNPETGTVQPLEKIGSLLSGRPVIFHSDMVQGFGKLPVDAAGWGVDSLSVSAHKIHGPKGIGAAYMNPEVSWTPFIPGSVHENGFRPGTVDVPASVAFAQAAKQAETGREENFNQVTRLKDLLVKALEARCNRTWVIEGDPDFSSPYIVGLRIHGMQGQYAMLECSQKGLAISTGSACQVNEQKPSATLLAMGLTEEEAGGFIRLSLDSRTTVSEVEKAAEILSGVIEKHRKVAGL